MNVDQIRKEVGPEAAKLAERYVERLHQRLQAAKYNLELARQMQQMPKWIRYDKPRWE